MDEPNDLWVAPDLVKLPKACEGVDGVALAAATLASSVLFLATGNRFPREGLATVRPNDGRCWAGPWVGPGVIHQAGYRWARPGQWWGPCDCPSGDRIGFPFYPVTEVLQVLVDGNVVDTGDYALDAKRWLVRLDGTSWPRTQDVLVPSTEPDTFEVQIAWGAEPPAAGLIAAREYARHLAMVLCPGETDGECEIPSPVISMVRQGMTASFGGPGLLLTDGLTGVRSVDQWIVAVNGGIRPNHPAVVASVESVLRRSRARWTRPADAS